MIKTKGTFLFSILFLLVPVLISAQSKAIKKQIKELKDRDDIIYVESSNKNKDEATKQSISSIKKKIVARYNIIETVSSNIEQQIEDQATSLAITKIPLNANEITWKRRGKHYSFVFAELKSARDYAVQRATIAFRNQNRFNFGEAYSDTEEQAISIARGYLINQFSVNITSTIDVSTNEKSVMGGESARTTGFSQEISARNKVYSRMQLQGLRTITLDLDDKKYAFAYISMEDKAASFKTVKSKITTSADEAFSAWESGNVVSGLKGLYATYILCNTYYKEIDYTFPDGTKTDNLKQSLQSKLVEILNDETELQTRPSYRLDERDIVMPFKLVYNGKPLDGLIYQFKYQSFNFVEKLRNGRGRLTLPGYYPEFRKESFTVQLFIDIRDAMKNDADLAELEPANQLVINKTIEADFTNVFKFSVEGKFYGKRVDLKLTEIEARLLKVVKWDLGNNDERYTSDGSLSYSYEDIKTYPLRIEINEDTLLSISRYINLNEKTIRINPKINTDFIANRSTDEKIESAIANIKVDKKKSSIQIDLNPFYQEIADMQTTSGLISLLRIMKDREEIIFGKQADMVDSEGALILVADQEKVYDRLIFNQNRFYKISDGNEIPSLNNEYEGKYLIWVKRTNN